MGAKRREGVWSGRLFSADDLELLRTIIRDHPTAHRVELSKLACEALDWRGVDGAPRCMRMRVVMLRMHEAGIIALPAARTKPGKPKPERWKADAFQDPGAPRAAQTTM
jgi:hypothetical protein